MKSILALTALCIVLTGNSGCMSSVALQTLGAIGSTSPVAFNYLGRGKAESFWIARYDDVIEATLRAGEALSLELKEKKFEEDRASFRYVESRADKIDLLIERRTATMTSIRFNFGMTGSIAFARLVSRQIICELTEAGAFLEDWTPDMHN